MLFPKPLSTFNNLSWRAHSAAVTLFSVQHTKPHSAAQLLHCHSSSNRSTNWAQHIFPISICACAPARGRDYYETHWGEPFRVEVGEQRGALAVATQLVSRENLLFHLLHPPPNRTLVRILPHPRTHSTVLPFTLNAPARLLTAAHPSTEAENHQLTPSPHPHTHTRICKHTHMHKYNAVYKHTHAQGVSNRRRATENALLVCVLGW